MTNQDPIKRIVALGFSENAATEIVDYLGDRVYAGEKETKIKRRDVQSKDPA